MRFQNGHAEVQAEGFGETASMTIMASAKAFKGLIDGLYSRKIEAAIRELATNAFDAHKMVGSIAPFDIHLPTPLKPTFWVRDYGPGMSHEFMTKRYTVMFDSTKDGLNEDDASRITPDDQVGCLGLGRMSFFAYTDACTVTIWQNGEARFYSVYMGAKGIPDVSLAGTTPSDEPDGVKVEFAAKARDFKAFETAAVRVFKGFPIVPNGLPIDAREAIATPPLEMGSIWKAYPKDYLPGGGFYARQGCVLYPIDLTQIDDRAMIIDDEDGDGITITLSENYARFAELDMTVVLEFPIGSVDFDLSRERLAYNDSTIAALRGRWDEFMADLDTVINRTFAGKQTAYERYLAARSPLFASMGPLFQKSMFFVEAGKTEEFIHELLPRQRKSFDNRTHAFKRIVEFRDEGSSNDNIRNCIFTFNQRMTYNAPEAKDLADAVFVYVDDAGRHLNARVHHHLRANGVRYACIFEAGCLTLSRWREMGCPPILRSSAITLPKDVEEKIARTGVGGGGVFNRMKVIKDDRLIAAGEDFDAEDHVFAFVNCGVAQNPNPERYPDMSIDDIIAINALLEATGAPSIAFVNTRSNDKEGRWDHLPLFYDYLDTLAERLTKKHIGQFIAWSNSVRFSGSRYDKAIKTFCGGSKQRRQQAQNPLTKLDRFDLSKSQTDPELTPRYAHIFASTNPALIKITNDVFHIAAGMGMEVLPPREVKGDGFAIDLLPKSWEEAVTHINNSHQYSGNRVKAMRAFYDLLFAKASA